MVQSPIRNEVNNREGNNIYIEREMFALHVATRPIEIFYRY